MDARNQVQAAVQKVLDKIDVLQHGPPEDLAKNVQSYLHQLSEVDRKAPLLGKRKVPEPAVRFMDEGGSLPTWCADQTRSSGVIPV